MADLKNVRRVAPRYLIPWGPRVLSSFNYLEDMLVKEAFRFRGEEAWAPWAPLTQKPLTPGFEEVAKNPRSRSAKLRAAEKA